jgi:WD40 repeat protein
VFTSDDKWIVSGSTDRTIKIWDAASGSLTTTLSGHATAVSVLAISPDGKYLASGGADGEIRIWDAASLERTAHPPPACKEDHGARVQS